MFILHLSRNPLIQDTRKSLDLPPKTSVQQTSIGKHDPWDHVKLIVAGVLYSPFGISQEAAAKDIIVQTHSSKITHYKIIWAILETKTE